MRLSPSRQLCLRRWSVCKRLASRMEVQHLQQLAVAAAAAAHGGPLTSLAKQTGTLLATAKLLLCSVQIPLRVLRAVTRVRRVHH